MQELNSLLVSGPDWLLITDTGSAKSLMPVKTLALYLSSRTEQQPDKKDDGVIDLLEIPAQRFETAAASLQSSVFDAWEMMGKKQVDSLYIISKNRQGHQRITGVLTKEDLERYSQV